MRKSLFAATIASLLTACAVAMAQVPGVNSTLQSVFILTYDLSTMKPTFSAASPQITPASSTQDICSISGSATKNIRVRRIIVNATGAAASVTEPIAILKRSTAYTAGAGSAITQVPYDSTNSLTGAAQTTGTAAMVEAWTSNPTAGTLVGAISEQLFFIGSTTTAGHQITFTFGERGSAIILRGAAQNLAVNFAGNTISGTVSCTFEWTEE